MAGREASAKQGADGGKAAGDRVVIFDTTLRDGEQSPGASMTRDEKVRIAKALEKLRVDVIEAGFPIASPGDFEAVKAVAESVKDSTVCGLARALDKDIDRAGEALQDAVAARIHTFIATSPIHMKKKLRMQPDQVLEQAVGDPGDFGTVERELLGELLQLIIRAAAQRIAPELDLLLGLRLADFEGPRDDVGRGLAIWVDATKLWRAVEVTQPPEMLEQLATPEGLAQVFAADPSEVHVEELLPELEAEGERMAGEALAGLDDRALARAIEERGAALERWRAAGAALCTAPVFVLAMFVGFEVITKVPPTLHTPLMSGSNAISGISIVGALVIAGMGQGTMFDIIGMVAVIAATINVVGGFMVTDRMLQMFRRDTDTN